MMLFAMRMNNANKLMLKASPKKIINLQLFASVCNYNWNYYCSNTVGAILEYYAIFSRLLQRPTTLCRSCWKQKTSKNNRPDGVLMHYIQYLHRNVIQILFDLCSSTIVKSARIKLFQQMPWRKYLSIGIYIYIDTKHVFRINFVRRGG